MLVDTIEKYEDAKVAINSNERTLFEDTETDGLAWQHDNEICSVQIRNAGKNYYFPFRHKSGPNLPEPLLLDLFENIMRPDREQCYFHAAFDIKMGAKDGQQIPHRGKMRDAQLDIYLCNENEPSLKMETLAEKYIGPGYEKAEEALCDKLQERYGGSRKTCKAHLHKLPASEVYEYGCQDIVTTELLDAVARGSIAKWKLQDVSRGVADFQLMTIGMELRGMPADRAQLDILSPFAVEEAERLRAMIAASAGYPINPNSNPQVNAWLGTTANNKNVLAALEDDERVQLLQDYRAWARAESTYFRPYRNSMRSGGTVWYNLNLSRTVTGRLSCTDVAMQTVPRYDPDKSRKHYRMKEVFKAPPGYSWLEIDLSQAELRLACHFSQDPMMTALVHLGADMHGFVSKKNNVPRPIAKNMNFSAIYGIGPPRFSEQYAVPLPKAKKYLAGWHALFVNARKMINAAKAIGEQQGYIRAHTGRVRRFNKTRDARPWTAANFMVQGGIGEIVRESCLRLQVEVPEFDIRLLVHDSFLGLVRTDIVRDVARRSAAIIQDQPWCRMPVVCDIKISEDGGRWSDMHPMSCSCGDRACPGRTRAGITTEQLRNCKDKTLLGPHHA